MGITADRGQCWSDRDVEPGSRATGIRSFLSSRRVTRDTLLVMALRNTGFAESVRRQIALNQARSPTERMLALCELLDVARAMAPDNPEARARRLRAQVARKHDREQWHAECKRLLAAQRSFPRASL